MADIDKHFGRLLTLVLFGLFIWRVALSGQMLLDNKISSSVSKQYSKWRLFPSLSICLGLKNVIHEEILDNIDGNLQRLLDEVVVSFWHKNVSESGRIMLINKTALIAHVGSPWWEANACITYEPSGPTTKSRDGVLKLELNTSHMRPNSKIFVLAYRKGSGIIPSIVRPYGSELFKTRIVGNFSSDIRLVIKRSEIDALDKLSQRCDPSKDEPSVSKCVEERFVERYLNCSLKRFMSNPMLGICNQTKWDFSKKGYFHQRFTKLNRLDEKEIFEMTGCKPGCSKSKIELVTTYQDNMRDDDKNVAKFSFSYNRGEYDLWEEYYIYNWGSFIADVGGYLGLLLGSSVLSMYHMTTPLLMQQMKWLAKKMVKRNDENC